MVTTHWLGAALIVATMGACQKPSAVPSAVQKRAQTRAEGRPDEAVRSLADQTAADRGDQRESEARAAVGRLKRALKGALQTALPAGFDAAVKACQLRAPEVAAAVSTGDVVVGRATDRPRNPHNVLQPWMKPVMERFAKSEVRRGTFETLSLPDGRWAYAEPIRVLPLCVACHGESLAASVRAALSKRYPDDKATGYAVGDLRGIFWVTMVER